MTAKRLSIKKRDMGHRPPQTAALADIVTDEDKVRLNVVMSKSKRQALKTKAAMEGRTVQEIVNHLVDEYLNR